MGAIYRYGWRRSRIVPSDVLPFIGWSFLTGIAVAYVVGYFDFLYNNASLLGFNSDSLKIPALLGGLVLIYLSVHFFIVLLRKK